ncbi:hypothetical protein [Geopsychrobacter electrodiphilus]|uniref:hypothetical protein n=1 Tax=Geopsychrobacter electrodiphilus TaxID=225196 RepID=UPI0003626C70|nr:hypothetical protein [Geopsychrobacter electrodiphilus]
MFGVRKFHSARVAGIFSTSGERALVILDSARGGALPQVHCCELFASDTAVADYVRTQHLRRMVCVDVLPISSYSQTLIDISGVKEEERREAARWQLGERLDYPVEEAIVDLFEVPVVGAENKKKTFAIAAPRRLLQQRVASLKLIGLRLAAIDIPELALRNLLALFPDEPHGLGLLWFRDDNCLLVIMRGETIFFSRVINIGLTQLAQHETPAKDGLLAEGLQTLLDGVVLEIQRSLDFCESNFRLPPVPKILVAMCGPACDPLLEYLARYLQSMVCPADFHQILDLPTDVSEETINSCLPALGAALRAGGRA